MSEESAIVESRLDPARAVLDELVRVGAVRLHADGRVELLQRAYVPSRSVVEKLRILGADVAAQCLRHGLVDEILVYVLPLLLGDGIRFSPPGFGRIDLEPFGNTQSGAVTMLRFRVRK